MNQIKFIDPWKIGSQYQSSICCNFYTSDLPSFAPLISSFPLISCYTQGVFTHGFPLDLLCWNRGRGKERWRKMLRNFSVMNLYIYRHRHDWDASIMVWICVLPKPRAAQCLHENGLLIKYINLCLVLWAICSWIRNWSVGLIVVRPKSSIYIYLASIFFLGNASIILMKILNLCGSV